MTQGGVETVGTFVEPRGMVRSIVAGTVGREVLGAVGAMSAQHAAESQHAGSSPIRAGQIAHLELAGNELALFRAKRGAFRPKATDEVIATAPRTSVSAAKLERGRLAGVLEVMFADAPRGPLTCPRYISLVPRRSSPRSVERQRAADPIGPSRDRLGSGARRFRQEGAAAGQSPRVRRLSSDADR
jgi:hypothetical protein